MPRVLSRRLGDVIARVNPLDIRAAIAINTLPGKMPNERYGNRGNEIGGGHYFSVIALVR